MSKAALQYFGRDYDFANVIPGLPEKLSDVKGLEIGSFRTNDGVNLAYWKAGQGMPLVFVPSDIEALEYVLFDHILNDWRDVLIQKTTRPTLVVSGEHSNWVESQRWIAETVPDGRAIIYSKSENGDHFLHLKEPQKFASQLHKF
ncbi:alpha/beta hydrolase [Dickeya dianthicola]|uniref:alpha/beta fold hydrolase n=1 Tax=Dickeya dianthicola TaxID=204039 RepID=UPI00136DA8C8|nr:alpha/beta hydrolase [Dickeya dianthicola]MCI4237725.1 alpha/beta hydrolase [Dickeya dianthicola]MCI4255640.1 alpha/beta hydrolase [Dickeya dianthicola]MZG23854.1 alpha/beta hydrolase [Dickeya dianthicola]MZI90846.1 alpha/beta hydrolase [Dickeya dianthicola]